MFFGLLHPLQHFTIFQAALQLQHAVQQAQQRGMEGLSLMNQAQQKHHEKQKNCENKKADTPESDTDGSDLGSDGDSMSLSLVFVFKS